VIVDLGTGDGHFVYESARSNPGRFYIGIDANPSALEKVSEKIHRKAAKGGLSNVLFLHASAEELPQELNGLADEIHIHFPWGSLLRSVALGEKELLSGLRRISSSGALLEVVIGIDPERDKTELARLQIEPITQPYLEERLIPLYKAAGFAVVEAGIVPSPLIPPICTSWAKRLSGSSGRVLTYMIAQAI